MIDAGDLRKGSKILIDNVPYAVLEAEHVKPGKGSAFARVRIKNLESGQLLERTFKMERFVEPNLDFRQMQYLYAEGDMYVFMDSEDYTQYTLDASVIGYASGYIVDGIEGCFVQLIDDAPVALQLPPSVILEVIDTAPEMKGATATKRPKPAKLSTGLEILVPEYIKTGEKITVNTTTGEFSGRA